MRKIILLIILPYLVVSYRSNAQIHPDNLLLKDFKPVSIYHTPVTEISKARFKVIDMHAHPYPENETELVEWIQTMNKAGIDKSVMLTYAHGPAFDSLINIYAAYKDRFELWCGFDYTTYQDKSFPEKAISELERCYRMGARGVGELGDKGKGLFYAKPPAYGMHPDDDRMVPLFTRCAELNMPVNIHIAEPKWMYESMDETNDGLMNAYTWRLDNQEGIKDHGEMMAILDRTLTKNKATTFVACHLANSCYNLDIVGKLLDDHPNLYIDIAARYAEFAPIPRTSRLFFEKYQDRIVYGTDMGTQYSMYQTTFRILESADEHFYDHDRFSYHWPLYGLDLDDAVLEKIYHKNAERIVGK